MISNFPALTTIHPSIANNQIAEGGQAKKKTFHLDPKDFFWSKYAGVQFPQVAENVDAELSKYREEHDRATRMAGGDSASPLDMTSTDSLKSLVSNLPALTEKKRIIDMHMNIATSLLKSIKERQLDFFVQFEETIMKQVCFCFTLLLVSEGTTGSLSSPSFRRKRQFLRPYAISKRAQQTTSSGSFWSSISTQTISLMQI